MRARLATCLFGTLLPALALAWGPNGHRIVADIAQARLDPAARAQVALLLAGEPDQSLAGIANWADDLRDNDPALFRRTSRWHFVNFHRRDCDYVPERDCPHGQCAIAAIQQQLRLLGDRHAPQTERAQALKFVVHLIGDIHQPLHTGNRADYGGNDYQINYHGRGSNLHRVWDGLILGPAGFDEAADAARLARTPLPAGALATDADAPIRWAEESCRTIDADGIYPRGHVIDRAYLQRHRALAERQLRLAGERLAAELNAVLGDGR